MNSKIDMLNKELIKKIEDFVSLKPRSTQEIAQHIGKNWRTADRYIDEIEKEFGTISTRTFRGGTRGALKIVYWASVEKAKSSTFQQHLEEQILRGRKKEDFSAFDIYQHIEESKKDLHIKTENSEEFGGLKELKELILSAKKQMLVYSGNLSFINFKDEETDIFSLIEEIVRNNIPIKVLSRVDLAGRDNVDKLLSLNLKYGKNLIEVRHREQPLRCLIIDNNYFNIKEIKEPTGRSKELDKKVFIFYNIKDKEWTEWISKLFWKMFSSSVDAEKRLNELNKIKI